MVTLKGKAVKLYGNPLEVGQSAPIVNLTDRGFATHKVGGATGKYQLISIIPSIDGGCAKHKHALFTKRHLRLLM